MFKKISFIICASLLFSSCEVENKVSNNCPIIIGVSATSVTGPTETTVDVPINLEVSYVTKPNCGSFTSFFKNQSTDAFIDIITVNSNYDACSCDQLESVLKQDYIFRKTLPGVYTVKFRETNDTFIEHIVTVQ